MFKQDSIVQEAIFSTGTRRLNQALLLAALLLLLLAAAPSAQAQGKRCFPLGRGVYYWHPDSGFFSPGRLKLYGNNQCTGESIGTWNTGRWGMVFGGGQGRATDDCNEHNGTTNLRAVSLGDAFWSCEGSSSSSGGSSSSKRGSSDGGRSDSSGDDSGDGSTVAKSRPTPERQMTGVNVAAELGMNSGIHFKRLSAIHVGIQSVVDRGVLDVVDVWGNTAQYFEVCFPQAGTVVFLDAATSPRTVVEVSNFTKDEYSCAAMDRAGTMVLVAGSADSSTSATGSTTSAEDLEIARRFVESTTDPVSTAIELETCEVTLSHKLNLRQAPWETVVGVVQKHTVVSPSARTQSWFRVTHNEIEGWIAAWLTTHEGDCEWETEEDDGPALAKNQPMPAEAFIQLM